MELIASRKNPLVTRFRQIAHGRSTEPGSILLEGLHVLQEARASGSTILVAVFSTAALETGGEAAQLADALEAGGHRVVQVSDAVMEAMSPVQSPSGAIGIGVRPSARLASVFEPAPALTVVAMSVQNPGNLGAIIRTAHAAGATGAIVTGASADPFGWKAQRGAMGSGFHLPVAELEDAHASLDAARDRGLRIVNTAARAGDSVFAMDWTGPVALLVGGEGAGVAPEFARRADCTVSIPMRPPAESLNVAVAAGVLLYEARRQRSRDI